MAEEQCENGLNKYEVKLHCFLTEWSKLADDGKRSSLSRVEIMTLGIFAEWLFDEEEREEHPTFLEHIKVTFHLVNKDIDKEEKRTYHGPKGLFQKLKF
jgi:hypothetical protein